MLWILAMISAVPSQAADILLKKLELEVELPCPGDGKRAFKPKLISAKSAYGDLAASNDVVISNISWDGTFGESEGDYSFQAGYTYRAVMSITFTHKTKDYYANNSLQNGAYHVKDFTLTINGIPTTMQLSTGIAPRCVFNYTVPGELSDSITEKGAQRFYDQIKVRRSTPYLFGKKYADSLLFENNRSGLIESTTEKSLGDILRERDIYAHNVDKVLLQGEGYSDYQMEDCIHMIVRGMDRIEELWISNEMDAADILLRIYKKMLSPVFPNYIFHQYYVETSLGPCTHHTTIFVPEAQLKAVKEYLNGTKIQPVYSIRAYRGNVRDAMAKNDTYKICKKHVFTATIQAADRAYEYGNCDHDTKYFYSCTLCGECERNPKHVFRKLKMDGTTVGVDPNDFIGHNYELYIADDDHYVGTNVAGQHIYWKGCVWCGKSEKYHSSHPRSLI